jgi:hypothetical protein
MEQAVKSQPLFDVGIPIPLIEDPTMRFLTLVACAALTFTALDMSAVERCSPNTGGSVWIEGSWQQCGGQHTWRPGYWQATQTTTTVYTTPSTTWIEGHWAQGANGSVWVEGHYQQAPAICTTGTTVVYNPPPQVVYVQPRPCPQTTMAGTTADTTADTNVLYAVPFLRMSLSGLLCHFRCRDSPACRSGT